MTSLRYSNDKADKKDFIRSFLKAIPYSVIALLVLSSYFVMPVVQYVTSKEFKQMSGPKNIISFFGTDAVISAEYLHMGMVCCGILTAIVLFRFMFTKKSVNVYFSMGITRTRLYLNRILAGALSLCIGVLIPTAVSLLVNLASFGSSHHLYNVFFYEFLALFASGLAGFAIAAFATTVSGSIIEAVVTSGTISFIPIILNADFESLKYSLLRGFYYSAGEASNIGSMLSPFTFVYDMNYSRASKDDVMANPIDRFAEMLEGKTIPQTMSVDFDVMAPIIFWLIASIVLFALGLVLMNKRKAEHANTFGKFYVSSAINGTAVYSVVLYACIDIIFIAYSYKQNGLNVLYGNLPLCIFVLCIIQLIAFMLGMLIIRRKVKATVRQIPVFAFLFAITIFSVVFVSSEYFGTYNKLPSTSEIASVSFDLHDSRGLFQNYSYDYYENSYSSSDSEDIKLATDLFEQARKDKNPNGNGMVATLRFSITLKDKSVISRSFEIYSYDLLDNYDRKTYDSNYYRSYLKALLIEDPVIHNEESTSTDDYFIHDEYGPQVSDRFENGKYKTSSWSYVGASSMFNGFDRQNYSITADSIEDSEGLCKALYNDLIKLPYDKVYHNTSRPLGVLTFFSSDAYYTDEYLVNDWERLTKETEYYTMYGDNLNKELRQKYTAGYASSGIYIYPEMTETIKFLKDNGYNPIEFNGKVKEVYFADSKLSLSGAINISANKLFEKDKEFYKEYRYYFNDIDSENYESFCINQSLNSLGGPYFPYINHAIMAEDNTYKETVFNLFTKSFDDAGVKLNKVTDQKKAEQIVSKAVPFIDGIKSDDGRFIYIVYDNGVISEEYVPSVNVSVLK